MVSSLCYQLIFFIAYFVSLNILNLFKNYILYFTLIINLVQQRPHIILSHLREISRIDKFRETENILVFEGDCGKKEWRETVY